MSTYYEGCLITNKKWITKDIDMNCVKTFNFDDMEGVYNENLIDEAKAYTSFDDFVYVGMIKKEDFEAPESYLELGKKVKEPSSGTIIAVEYSENKEEEIKNLLKLLKEDFDYKTYIALSEEQRKEEDAKYYNLFIKTRYYYTGEFYNVKSFIYTLAKYEKLLKDAKYKKHRWNKIKSSIEYCKLSDEEKENVALEFDYIEGDVEEYKTAVNSLKDLIGTLRFFSGYDEDAYFYIYNTDNSYREFPKWLEEKLGYR